jgi:hypothetical protein
LAVFAREFWFQLLQFVGLAALTPQPSDSFADWWEKVEGLVCDELRAGLNSLSHFGQLDYLEASQWLCLQWGFSKSRHCSGLSKRWSPVVGFGWYQRPLLAHYQGLWLISGGLLVWFGQVRLLQACFGPDGDDGQVVRSWPCGILVYPLE